MSPADSVESNIALQTRRCVTRRLMPFLFLLYVVAYVDRINISFAGLQMTVDLHFSDAVFGLGSGVFFIGYLLLGIPGAMLVEKWSARKMMAVTMLVWGAVASATGFIHTAPQFYTMRFLLGVTEAGFFPGMITYLSHWYRPQDRAKAVALFMTAVPVAQVIAAPLSAALMKVHWLGLGGWRWLLILEGVPALACGIASLRFLTDWPSEANWLTEQQREWLTAQVETSRHQPAAAGSSLLDAVRHRDVLLLGAAYFGSTIGLYGLGLWMPKMLQRLGSLTAVHTALLSALPAMAAIPAMLLNGWHSDRSGERRWHTAIAQYSAAAAFAGVAFLNSNVPVALILFAIASAGIMAAYSPLWSIPRTILGGASAAASVGIINAFGNLGGFAGPSIVGWLSARTGAYAAGLWFLAAAMFVSATLVLQVRVRTAVREDGL